jgi:hypothetical protein
MTRLPAALELVPVLLFALALGGWGECNSIDPWGVQSTVATCPRSRSVSCCVDDCPTTNF